VRLFTPEEAVYIYRAGYRIGWDLGEQAARMTDAALVEAIARRARVLEAVDGEIAASIRATIAGIDAERYRQQSGGAR